MGSKEIAASLEDSLLTMTVAMEHLIEPLKNLGLSEKEAKIYLALLQLGPSTPYQIAKKAEIKRPTAYVIAEELVEKGLIVHVPGETPKKYIARTPETVIGDAEIRLSKVKSTLPELRSLQKTTTEKPTVLYFEGVEGVRQALFHRIKELHNTEALGFYADPEYANKALLPVTLEFNEYRDRHHIKARGFVTDSKELIEMGFDKYFNLDDPAKASINAKILPKDRYSSNASLEFYPDFVKIIFFGSAQSVIIESRTVAQAMRQIFELLWSRIDKDEFRESKFLKKNV